MNDKPPSSHTRRGFLAGAVAVLGGVAATFALSPIVPVQADRPQSPWVPKNRWIGHC